MTLSKTPFQRNQLLSPRQGASGGFIASTAIPPTNFEQVRVLDSTPEPEVEVVEEEPTIPLSEHEQLLEDATQQAYEQGKKDATQALRATLNEDKVHLTSLCESFTQLIDNKHALYEPLKKLSLKLAELLVQGELTADSGYIDRLISMALDAMDTSPDTAIELVINPEDHPLLGETIHRFNQIKWTHDIHLPRGSVRAISTDIVVENLFVDRLHDLQKQLGLEPFAPLELSTAASSLDAEGAVEATEFDDVVEANQATESDTLVEATDEAEVVESHETTQPIKSTDTTRASATIETDTLIDDDKAPDS